MEYSHDIDQASEYSEMALKRIRREGLAPTPKNYELWYVYYSGQSPELARAIDVLITNKQRITEERCQEISERFLSAERREKIVRQAGDQINATIQNVTGVVRDVKTATSEYSGRLGGITDKMRKVKDPDELRQIVTTVMSDTENMLSHNRRLEEQLDQSSMIMEELQRDLENVRREALTDGLTGLANRKAFDAEIASLFGNAQAGGSGFSLLMMDIDHFKNFNDNFGHQIGDQVLRLVARTLVDGVKGRDMAARYGGEEFAILLPETPLEASIRVAESLRKAVASKDVINRNSGEKLGRITMSVGAAEYAPGESMSDLIGRADMALYTAKHNGRNQVASSPTPGKKSSRRKENAG